MAIYRVTAKMRVGTNEQRHVWYVGNQDTTGLDVQGAIGDMTTIYASSLAPLLGPEWRLYGWTYQDMSVADQPVVPYEVADVVGALIGSQQLPYQVTAIVSFRSYTAKPNRGHKNIGGLTESQVTDGLFVTGTVLGLDQWAEDLVGMRLNNPAKGIALAHYDAVLGKVTSANPATAWSVNNNPGTLRSRRQGRGI